MLNNLKRYERDGLMTYIDKLRYDNFTKNTDGRFKKTQEINFVTIQKQAKEEKIEVGLLKKI